MALSSLFFICRNLNTEHGIFFWFPGLSGNFPIALFWSIIIIIINVSLVRSILDSILNNSKVELTRSRLFEQIIIKYIKLNVESSSNHHHWRIYIINTVHGTSTSSYPEHEPFGHRPSATTHSIIHTVYVAMIAVYEIPNAKSEVNTFQNGKISTAISEVSIGIETVEKIYCNVIQYLHTNISRTSCLIQM